VAFVDEWAATHERDRLSPARPVGELARLRDRRGGRAGPWPGPATTVGEVLARIRSADARSNFLRLLYLLVETEYVGAS
jgi:hypothetical protein